MSMVPENETREVSARLMAIVDATVRCPFCGVALDLYKSWLQVDDSNLPVMLFCNWKHLGRWIAETYEKGEQFKVGIERG